MLKQHAVLCHLQHKVEVVAGHKHVLELHHVWVVEHIVVLQPAVATGSGSQQGGGDRDKIEVVAGHKDVSQLHHVCVGWLST